jgi:hypothetical protein
MMSLYLVPPEEYNCCIVTLTDFAARRWTAAIVLIADRWGTPDENHFNSDMSRRDENLQRSLFLKSKKEAPF